MPGAIIASGQVEVDQNRQVVQHPDGGIVAEIVVDEGDFVDADTVLLRLDAEELQSTLSITENQLFEVMARHSRWEAERDGSGEIAYGDELLGMAAERPHLRELMDGQSRLFTARIESLTKEVQQLGARREQIQTQVDGLKAQLESLQTQLDLINEELVDQQTLLDRGLAQANRVLALRREAAGLEGRRGELIASTAQAAERMIELDIETGQAHNDAARRSHHTAAGPAGSRVGTERGTRALQTRLSRLEIRAPVSGVIYSMQVFAPRSVIRAAEPVLYLIPQDRPMVVAAKVDPIHVDQVFVSQEVVVKFSAFDSRTTPELFGTVVQVSADAFVDERTQATYYRAEIRLTEDELAKLPEGLVMVPGMPVETFIKTDARTPLAYLVRPLTDYFAKAFRES